MSHHLSSTFHGQTVALEIEDVALSAALRALPYWWHSNPATAAPERTWILDNPVSAPGVIAELEVWVVSRAPGLIFVEAGVVARNGRALLLPGSSFAGKTTLVAELVSQGAHYASDEFAAIDADGLVHPYPRPLWIRDGSGNRSPVRVETLGGTTVKGPLTVASIAFLTFDPILGWAVKPQTWGETILGLISTCLPARSRSEEMMTTLAAATPVGGSIRGSRGEAAEAAAALLQDLDNAPSAR